MLKTLKTILATRPWVAFIDDERDIGNSIIVTLADEFDFANEPGCGVQGHDTVREVEIGTRWDNIIPHRK